jgi:hypothetical protein
MSNNSKYKLALCRHYNTNKGCTFGDKCQYAHGDSDLRSSVTKILKNRIKTTTWTLVLWVE